MFKAALFAPKHRFFKDSRDSRGFLQAIISSTVSVVPCSWQQSVLKPRIRLSAPPAYEDLNALPADGCGGRWHGCS